MDRLQPAPKVALEVGAASTEVVGAVEEQV
jgi:hypothetical protein